MPRGAEDRGSICHAYIHIQFEKRWGGHETMKREKVDGSITQLTYPLIHQLLDQGEHPAGTTGCGKTELIKTNTHEWSWASE
jgi:hypothetical protein